MVTKYFSVPTYHHWTDDLFRIENFIKDVKPGEFPLRIPNSQNKYKKDSLLIPIAIHEIAVHTKHKLDAILKSWAGLCSRRYFSIKIFYSHIQQLEKYLVDNSESQNIKLNFIHATEYCFTNTCQNMHTRVQRTIDKF